MAIKLIANYSKRLGLPGYSSHQFSVEIEAELSNLANVPKESARIYGLLQANVDEQIRTTGFVPPADYGMDGPASGEPNNRATRSRSTASGAWQCTAKQRELIENFVEEQGLDKGEVEALARERFGKGVRLLRKQEASGLIDELFATYGRQRSASFTGRAA